MDKGCIIRIQWDTASHAPTGEGAGISPGVGQGRLLNEAEVELILGEGSIYFALNIP